MSKSWYSCSWPDLPDDKVLVSLYHSLPLAACYHVCHIVSVWNGIQRNGSEPATKVLNSILCVCALPPGLTQGCCSLPVQFQRNIRSFLLVLRLLWLFQALHPSVLTWAWSDRPAPPSNHLPTHRWDGFQCTVGHLTEKTGRLFKIFLKHFVSDVLSFFFFLLMPKFG